MGKAKRRITELNRKYKAERNRMGALAGHAREALEWWRRSMNTAAKLMDEMLIQIEKRDRAYGSFWSWVRNCPSKIIRIPALIFHNGSAWREVEVAYQTRLKKHAEYVRAFERWRVERILGDQDEGLSKEQVAQRANISVERLEEIAQEIAREAKVREALASLPRPTETKDKEPGAEHSGQRETKDTQTGR